MDFTGRPGKYVPIQETVRGFRTILNGEVDDIPEIYFFMRGGIEEVQEAYREDTAKDAAAQAAKPPAAPPGVPVQQATVGTAI